jgi:tetratricopeptide (TPR) repeat protein
MVRRSVLAVPLLAIGASCATNRAASPAVDRPVVTVGPEAVAQGPHGLTAWIVYGTARAKVFEERQGKFHNQSGDDYALELAGRAAMAEQWAAERAHAEKPNAYLDLLVDLRQSGHLDEYVVTFFAKPGWTVPGEALADFDLRGFTSWAGTRLDGHQPVTLVDVEPSSGRHWPDPPGATLPNPNELGPKKLPCASSAAPLDAALARWSQEAVALDGAPLAAADRAEFARLVDWARTQPEYRRRGVTWVSPAAADLYFVAGFCAVERKDLAAAARALGESVRLNPLAPAARLELSQVLVTEKKFDEADQQIDGVLATTSDRCELGRAWRARGYILVERGRLEEAYAAYQKSLEHDPTSKLAVNEMVFIVRELQRLGGSQGRAFKPYQPAATANQIVTECSAE